MDLESMEIYRLFYVDRNDFSNDEEYKLTSDPRLMTKVIRALNQFNSAKGQLFGIFGHEISLRTYLHSLFPSNQSQTDSIFDRTNPMPAIWVIYNNMKFVVLLLLTDDKTSKKEDNFMIVMQRLLQDICRSILICPSDAFFKNFSTDHSFQDKAFKTRTYHVIKNEHRDIPLPQKIKLDDKNNFKILLSEQCQNTLVSNTISTTYCLQKVVQGPNQSSTYSKFDQLKELLQTHLNANGNLTLRLVLDM